MTPPLPPNGWDSLHPLLRERTFVARGAEVFQKVEADPSSGEGRADPSTGGEWILTEETTEGGEEREYRRLRCDDVVTALRAAEAWRNARLKIGEMR